MALIGINCIAGVALAVILSSVRHISDKVFLEAAKVSVVAEHAGAQWAETLGFPVGFIAPR